MEVLRVVLFVVTLVSVDGVFDSRLQFISNFVATDYFQTRRFNSFSCNARDARELMKSVSSSSHHPLLVRDIRQSLNWVDTSQPQTFLLDTQCPQAAALLLQANELGLFRKPFSWLLLGPESDNTTQDVELSELNLLLDSQVVLVEWSEERAQLTGVYKHPLGHDVHEDLGVWDDKGLEMYTLRGVAVRRRDLQGVAISVTYAMLHSSTLGHLDDLVDKQLDSIAKVGYTVTANALKLMNASIEMHVRNSWGSFVNGSWTGMMADMASQRAELTGTPSFVTVERMNFLEYTGATSETEAKFIFLAPPLSLSNNIFTLPFSSSVWLASFVLLLLIALLLKSTWRIEDEHPTLPGFKPDWGEVFLVNLGAVCQQGSAVEPRGPSARIVTISLFLSLMFLYVAYSACIVALLQSSDQSISSITDLLNSPLKVGADDIVWSQMYFKHTTDPMQKAVYKKKIEPPGKETNFMPIEQGIARVRQGLFAFSTECNSGYQIIQKTFTEAEKCGLQETKERAVNMATPHVAIRKHSQFAEMFKISMRQVQEVGLQSRQNRRYYMKRPPCSSRGSNFVSVGLLDCYHAFLVLLYGLLTSLALLCLENCCKPRGMKGRGKTSTKMFWT